MKATKRNAAMRKRCLRVVSLAVLAMGGLLSAATPVGAHHTGFDKGEYETREGAAFVDLAVSFSPCCPGPSGQVDYQTFNLSAIAGEDYQTTSGTLTFPTCSPAPSSGAAPCTIRVPITNDDSNEGEEQFEVKLDNWRGVFAPSRTPAIVKIMDDDPKLSPGSSSPGSSSPGGSSSGVTAGAATHQRGGPLPTASKPHAASTELLPGPGFELIGSELASEPTAGARVSRDKGDIATTVALVLLAAVPVLGGGAWIWRRRSGW